LHSIFNIFNVRFQFTAPLRTSMATRYLTSPLPSTEMPRGIPYIIGNEAAERFSFYGMKTILAIFMTQYLLDTSGAKAPMSETQAKEWVHYFGSAVYATPLLGAIISDWLFGKYRTIMVLSLVYCAGHAVLALIDSPVAHEIAPRWLLACGLGLISIGSGGIKPCVSAHVGDQFGT
jgi:POT family proton-dependent oligopeptide transporter